MPKLKPTCTVELLDGTEITVENQYLHHSEEFLHYVCGYIGVAERDYLGLRYTNLKDGKISWLDVNEPLVRQLKKASRRRFKVGIQFFPDTIDVLQDEVTRYQFVLQTRENLLTGRWSCSLPTQALLASYIVQAEFQNYDVSKHGEEYLLGLQFAYCQNTEFLDKVSMFHKNHTDLSPSDADWLYMKTARKMIMYGMDVYDVVDGNGNVLTLGMDVYGIHVLFLNTVLHTFVWVLVSKVCCHGKEVLISIQVTSGNHSECITVGFMLTTERDAKRVSKACNQNKDFHNLGAIRKTVKKPNKSIACSHISTRVLPKDFKRVNSLEYCKLFENEVGGHMANGDSEETLNRQYSVEEASSKDTTTSNPELNLSKELSEEEAGGSSNIEKEERDSTTNVDLHTTETVRPKDERSELNSVFISEDNLVVSEVMNTIVGNVECNGIVNCETEADFVIPVDKQHEVTSEAKTTVHVDENVIVNDKDDVHKDVSTNVTTMVNVTTGELSGDKNMHMNIVGRESSVIEHVTKDDDDVDMDVDLLIIEESDIENLLKISPTEGISTSTNYFDYAHDDEYEVIENE